MSTTVTFNNTTYNVPNQEGEDSWGGSLTAYLVALASGVAVTSTVKQTVRVAVTTPITVSNTTDYTVISKLTSPGAVAVNLPAGATGRFFAIVDGTGDAGTNNITIDGNGAETINGSATHVINENYGGVVLAWNGTQWNIVSQFVGDSPSFTNITVTGTATVGTLSATTISGGTLSDVTIDGDSNTIQDLAITSLKTVLGDANKVLRRNASGVPESGLLVNANVDAAAAIDATKIADGTVTSTEFQYINSLSSNAQTQITNNLNTLTTHTGASTGVHGVTGSVVGASDTQTLLNKLISSTSAVTGALTLPTGTVAQRPSATAGMIRYNSDNAEFEGYANSAWQAVGGGINEQPLKNYLKSYAQAVVAPGTLSTVAVGGNIATTAGLFYADTTSGSAALSSSSSTALRGSTNYLSALSGADTAGGRFFQFPAFSLEGMDLGKPVSISFDVNSTLADGDYDVVIARYDSAGTFQELISVAGNASASSATPSAKLPGGTSQLNGFFIPSSTAGDLYALRVRRLVGSVQVRVDTLFVGPQPVRVGAAVTDWQSYTPSSTQGFGTVTSPTFEWKQIGDTLKVRGTFTTGTVAASEARISFPTGLTSSSSISTLENAGFAQRNATGPVNYEVYREASVTYFTFGRSDGSLAGLTKRNGSDIIGTGSRFSFEAECRISNWSSNVTMADRAVESYAFNTSTSTTASDTSSFGYGAGGAQIQLITAGLQRRVRFPDTIQPTDSLIFEVSSDQKQWFPLSSGAAVVNGSTIGAWAVQSSTSYGAGRLWQVNSTDVDVSFGQFSLTTGASWAATGQNYGGGLSTAYWRVRKVASGSQIGGAISTQNIVGRVDGNAPASGYIGEVVTSTAAIQNFPATGAYADLATVALTAGTWAISFTSQVQNNSATSTQFLMGIGTVTGNDATGLSLGSTAATFVGSYSGSMQLPISVPSFVVHLPASQTYRLKMYAAYSAGTPQVGGRITAIRIA